MCGAIYIGNTQQTFKKIMDGRFSNLIHLLKRGQNSDSFAAHFEQNFESNTPCTDLRKGVLFKVINHINPIFEMKKLPNLTATYVQRNV